MKTRTVTVQEGEKLGPIDWSYDFKQHDWSEGRGGMNPAFTAPAVEVLREVERRFNAGEKLAVWTAGDYRHDVYDIGMYDGWPFWKPTPCVFISSPLGGGTWEVWYNLRAIAEAPQS